jgi:hypothetical protein
VTRRLENLCRAIKADGSRCQAFAGASGFCVIHSSPDAARELGRKGGKARRKGLAEQLPEAAALSLRDTLREGLDPAAVLAAAHRALTGENEAARVSVIKFLADLEIYRRDEPKVEPAAVVERHDPAELVRKLWEVGVLRCGKCDGPLVPLSELHAP